MLDVIKKGDIVVITRKDDLTEICKIKDLTYMDYFPDDSDYVYIKLEWIKVNDNYGLITNTKVEYLGRFQYSDSLEEGTYFDIDGKIYHSFNESVYKRKDNNHLKDIRKATKDEEDKYYLMKFVEA